MRSKFNQKNELTLDDLRREKEPILGEDRILCPRCALLVEVCETCSFTA